MGLRGLIGGLPGGQEGIQGIPWGHRVGLMSLLMIHKAYMPVYSDPDFSCTRDGTDGTNQPKVVQEVLADLKRSSLKLLTCSAFHCVASIFPCCSLTLQICN